jgi:hypothetical protein
MITLALVAFGFGSVCRMVQGLVDTLLPYRWRRYERPIDGQAAHS